MMSRDNFALVVTSLLVAGLVFLSGPLCQKQKNMNSETEKPASAAMQPASQTITDSMAKPDETSVSDSMAMKATADTDMTPATADYYTCPMHPQVHRAKPGKCPICGMKLVLRRVSKVTPMTKK